MEQLSMPQRLQTQESTLPCQPPNHGLHQRRKFTFQSLSFDQWFCLELVTRVTIMRKFPFQQTWDGELKCDDDVGAHTPNRFQYWIDILGLLSSLAVLRYLAKESFQQSNLHLFFDASELNYGAAIYAGTTSDSGIHTSLSAAKSRFAPKKKVCNPKLEL